MSRTGPNARRPVRFLDDEGLGNRLRKEPIHRGPIAKLLIELVGDGNRAHDRTLCARLASFLEDVFGFLPYSGSETARLSLNVFHFAVGEQFNIRVLPDSHELWRKDARRTVVGRKGLVQLGHAAADSRFGLHQIYFVAGLGQIQRGLDTGDSSTYDKSRPYDIFGLSHSVFTLKTMVFCTMEWEAMNSATLATRPAPVNIPTPLKSPVKSCNHRDIEQLSVFQFPHP
jgi:hypothetical protein